MKNILMLFIALGILTGACHNNGEVVPTHRSDFKVTIENVAMAKDYFQTGTTDFTAPGESYSFSFYAGKGHRLSFAMMFGQSNDLFYAPDNTGIELFDGDGTALTGDITDLVSLWDAGTEVNEEPGTGANQAPRQSAPNTGVDENGVVQLVQDAGDGFSYPADEEVLSVHLSYDGNSMFTVMIDNVSDDYGFQTPLAPGVWVVHGGGYPLFETGSPASEALEREAEDGNNMLFSEHLSANSGYFSPIAPGIFIVHEAAMPVFTAGEADNGYGLESLSEDGDPSVLDMSLDGMDGVKSHGVYNTPVGSSGAGPIFPGQSFEFMIKAKPGEYLSFASMLGQSNDLFFASDDQGISLFSSEGKRNGDVTMYVKLWDAGTEVNEYPGAGNNQAPRQSAANTGMDEGGVVQEVNDGFTYPSVESMIKVTITPM